MTQYRVSVKFDGQDDGLSDAADKGGSSLKKLAKIATGVAVAFAAWKGLKAAFGFFSDASSAAAELESALIGVKRTTGLSSESIDELKQSFRGLSTELPISATDLAAIAEVAGQLGISGSTEEVRAFTEMIARANIAMPEFTGGAEEIATVGAKLKNVFDLTVEATAGLFDSINQLSNTTAATAPQIAEFMAQFTVAPQIGITAEQSAALGATFVALGQDASAAATRLTSAFQQMISEGKIGEAARLAGMTREQFTALADNDVLAALTAVTQGLGQITSSTERSREATAVFGRVGVRVVNTLIGHEQDLAAAVDASREASEARTAVEQEAATQNESFTAALTELQNAYQNVKTTVGDALNPVLRDLMLAMRDGLTVVQEGISTWPEWIAEVRETDAYRAVMDWIGQMSEALGGFLADIASGDWRDAWGRFTAEVDTAWRRVKSIIEDYWLEIQWWFEMDAKPALIALFTDIGKAAAYAMWESLRWWFANQFDWKMLIPNLYLAGMTYDFFSGSSSGGGPGSSAPDAYADQGSPGDHSGHAYGAAMGGGLSDYFGGRYSSQGRTPAIHIHFDGPTVTDARSARRFAEVLAPGLRAAIAAGRA